MTSIATVARDVIGGVDTHQDLHLAAFVEVDGTVLGTRAFPTTRAGYRALLAWIRSHGSLLRVGVESTGSYGAGLTRHLSLAGITVLEVTGPDRAARRGRGKDDTLDAIAAARAAASGRRVQVAKDRLGAVEALRVLRTTRRTAVKCRRAALQLLHNTIVATPDAVRDELRSLTRMQLIRTCAASRPNTAGFRDPAVETRIALRSLARRVLELDDEIANLDQLIEPFVAEHAPGLIALTGVAPSARASCSSPPATTLNGCARRPPSRCCAAPHPSRRLPERPNAID
jgi:transposase